MSDMTDKQKENERWYEQNKEAILENPEHRCKYLVIHEKSILASFKSEDHAIEFASNILKNINECLIQEAIDEDITAYVDL